MLVLCLRACGRGGGEERKNDEAGVKGGVKEVRDIFVLTNSKSEENNEGENARKGEKRRLKK